MLEKEREDRKKSRRTKKVSSKETKKVSSKEAKTTKPKLKIGKTDSPKMRREDREEKEEEPSEKFTTMSDFMATSALGGPVPPGLSEFMLPGTLAGRKPEGTSELSAAYSLAFEDGGKGPDLNHSTEPIPGYIPGKGMPPPGMTSMGPVVQMGGGPRPAIRGASPAPVMKTHGKSSSPRRTSPPRHSTPHHAVPPQSTLSTCESLSLMRTVPGAKTSVAGSAVVLSNKDLIKEQARQAARKAGIDLDESKSGIMMQTGSGMDASLIKHYYEKQDEQKSDLGNVKRESQEDKGPPDKS